METTGTALIDAVGGARPLDPVRVDRLAELVMHLTSCPPEMAIHAVQRTAHGVSTDREDMLEVVARALVSVRKGVDLRDEPVAAE